MAALTQARMMREGRIKNVALPLAAGKTAYANGMACLDATAATVVPGASGNTNLVRCGEFQESLDNSASTATSYVMVDLDKEVVLRYYDTVTGANAVTAAKLFATCYVFDDHTVTMDSSGNAAAGRVWVVDTVKGIGVGSISTT